MNVLRSGLVTMLLLAAFSVQAACTRPAREQFKKGLHQSGRARHRPQRRAQNHHLRRAKLRYVLCPSAANDRAAFDNILDWTQNNLAQGSLKEGLPARAVGARKRTVSGKCWTAIRPPMVMSGWLRSLLEAGRLWKEQRYTDIGSALLKRIAREEVVTVPWAGFHVVTGQSGFC